MSAEHNATCELIRQLAVSALQRDEDDGPPSAVPTADRLAGFENAKYLLREAINPVLCVVRTHLMTTYFHFRSVDGGERPALCVMWTLIFISGLSMAVRDRHCVLCGHLFSFPVCRWP